MVGYLASTLAAFSVIGTLSLSRMVGNMSVRNSILSLLSLRLCDSLVFLAAISSPYPYPLFPLLFLSRCMLGLSVAVIGIPSMWIADRVCEQERVATGAEAQSLLTASIVVGPLGGALLSQLVDAKAQPLALWAWCLLLRVSLFCMAWAWCDDMRTIRVKSANAAKKGEASGEGGGEGSGEEDATKNSRVLMYSAWCTVCMMIGTMSGFEALLGVSLSDSYGWDAASSIPYWVAMSIFSLAGSGIGTSAIRRFGWKACSGASGPASVCLLLSSFDVFKVRDRSPEWRLVLGAASSMPQVVLFTCLSSSMPLSLLPPRLHSSSMPKIQACMQVGRGAGPVLATMWYEWATNRWGKEAGYAANSMFSVCFLFLAWVPVMHRL